MALSLDPALATAQDGLTRKPLVSIVSEQWGEAIPFTGSQYTPDPTPEESPYLITTTTDVIMNFFIDGRRLKMLYTNDDKSTWIAATVYTYPSSTILYHAAGAELASGNIGLVISYRNTSNQVVLEYIIIDGTGTIVTGPVVIQNFGNITRLDGLDVLAITTSNFLLVYPKWVGTTYTLQKRTSSDFTTWSAESTISIAGLDSPRHKTYNVNLLLDSSGDVILFFDYVNDTDYSGVELSNIHMSTSSDNGASWGAQVQVTNYTMFDRSALHPVAIQKTAGTFELFYTEVASALRFDAGMVGWPSTPCIYSEDSVYEVEYDEVREKLIVISREYYAQQIICSVIQIDVPSWTVDKFWTKNTTPGFSAVFSTPGGQYAKGCQDGRYVALYVGLNIALIDTEADTIDHINFADNDPLNLQRNCDVCPGAGMNGNYRIISADLVGTRLYLLWRYQNAGWLWLSYIEFTDPPDPTTGYYQHVAIYEDRQVGDTGNPQTQWYYGGDIKAFESLDLIIVGSYGDYYQSPMHVYHISTGNRIKRYLYEDYSNFPRNGAFDAVTVQDGGIIFIWATFHYQSGYGQAGLRGLIRINLSNDDMTYFRPPYATRDDYSLKDLQLIENNTEILGTGPDGTWVFTISSQTWELWNNENVPGIDPAYPGSYSGNNMDCVAYDQENRLFFTGRIWASNRSWNGGAMYSRDGLFKIIYKIDASGGPSWVFGNQVRMVAGLYNEDFHATVESGAIWASWEHGDDPYLQWDKEYDQINLSDLIPMGSEVVVNWGLDAVATLEFELAFGWLFDPHNLLSIYNEGVRKGRKITLQFGEEIGGVPYMQNQGIFQVVGLQMAYAKEEDPVIKVSCEDQGSMWGDIEVAATDFWDGIPPRDALLDLFGEVLGVDVGGTSIPNPMANSHLIYQQYVDMSLLDIVNTLLSHFEYALYFDMNGKISMVRVTRSGTVTHVYTDNTTILDFSPDDTYSSFINRVIVTSESHDFIQVTYSEEPMATKTGMLGPFMIDNDKRLRIYYSEDRQQQAVNPWMETHTSVRDSGMYGEVASFFGWDGRGEWITKEDPDHRWVEVTIHADNLTNVFWAVLAVFAVTYYICLGCDAGGGLGLFGGCGP
jgi:hypothetical protein